VLLLLLLLAVAEEFGLDVVLGAFLAGIGVRNGTMLGENAAALVGAGALSVLVFPVAAVVIERRRRAAVTRAAPPVESGMSNLPRFRAVSP
jgi:hypothetical protein